MQTEAVRWSKDVAGVRSCRPLDGAAPAVVFAAVEAPALGPLPATPFVLATWSTGKVGSRRGSNLVASVGSNVAIVGP